LPRRPRRADADGRDADDGSTDVRVIERQGSRKDEHFTEGEPDLEAPEELAVLDLDDETVLEEDLDSRADLEDEVDEEVLASSLEHLVHDGDNDDDDGVDGDGRSNGRVETDGSGESVAVLLGDLEIEELEDREESLDRILRDKLAGDEEREDDLHELDIDSLATAGEVRLSSCGADEFVCDRCFLVRHRAQRAGASASRCHDCSS
jgi:hypothetical protein